MQKTIKKTKLCLFISIMLVFFNFIPVYAKEETSEEMTYKSTIQVNYGYKLEDGSFDVWKSVPGVIINESTVITLDITTMDYTETIKERKKGYESIGIRTNDLQENASFVIYDGGNEYKNVDEVIKIENEEDETKSFVILKTSEHLDNAISFSPGKPLNDIEISAIGFSSELMDGLHFAKSENLLKQKVKITSEDDKNINFSIDSPDTYNGSALVNGYNEFYGFILSTEDGGKAISRAEISKILDDNNIIYDTAAEIKPVDFTKLMSLTDAAREVEQSDVEYTEESMNAVEEAFSNAKKTLAKEDVTQNEVDYATNELVDAINNLEEVPKKSYLLPVLIIVTIALLLIAVTVVVVLCIKDKDFMYKFFGVKKKEPENIPPRANPSNIIDNNTPIEGIDFNVKQPVNTPKPMNAPGNIPGNAPGGMNQNPNPPRKEKPAPAPVRPNVQPVPDTHFNNSSNFQGGYIYEDRNDAPKNKGDAKVQSTSVLKEDIQSNNEIVGTPYIIRVSTGERLLINHNQFTIGRDYDVDYRIPENTYIGKCHCRFMEANGLWYIIDNNSANKTLVNGIEIAPNVSVPLYDKTEVILANEKFIFRYINKNGAEGEPLTDTGTLINEEDPDTNVLTNEELPDNMRIPYVIINGKHIKITKLPFSLGRSKSASYKYTNDKNVSREHIIIKQIDGDYYIMDNKSSNGTMLNNQPLDPMDDYILHDSDIITIMNDNIEFHIY